MTLRVFIGHDRREQRAYDVAARSAQRWGCQAQPIYAERLRAAGLLTRPVDTRGGMWDLHSGAPQSTEFAVSRFFTPLLAHSGLALFVDCDVVFLSNPVFMRHNSNPGCAVYVVKHPSLPDEGWKMDDQPQLAYARKCWSSVMLFDCDHPANKRLNLTALNQWPGRDLHALSWLADEEIGELEPSWNWLVGVQPKPAQPDIAHFTRGGPWIPGWEAREHDEIWLEASR